MSVLTYSRYCLLSNIYWYWLHSLYIYIYKPAHTEYFIVELYLKTSTVDFSTLIIIFGSDNLYYMMKISVHVISILLWVKECTCYKTEVTEVLLAQSAKRVGMLDALGAVSLEIKKFTDCLILPLASEAALF